MTRAGAHLSVAVVLGAAFVAVAACGDDREGGYTGGPGPLADGSVEAQECRFQCSIDGRQVIKACSGEVVETCTDDQACGEARCQAPCAAAAADRSSNGCDFYFQMPRFTKTYAQGCYAAFVVNTSMQPVDLELEYKGKTVDVSKALFSTTTNEASLKPQVGAIKPGESALLFLSDRDPNVEHSGSESQNYVPCPKGVVPAVVEEADLAGTGISSSFHMTSNVPIALSTIYPIGGASSYLPAASLILPVATWGQQHVVINGWEAGRGGAPGAQIVAADDNTEVTILPKKDIQDGIHIKGGPANVPIKYKLDRGQFLQITQDQELTGSLVTSSKPTALFGGHGCANVAIIDAACDILAQQIPAFEQWGSEYVGVGYRPRLDNEHEPMPYRIVAARNGTRLDYDPAIPPGAPTLMQAGEVVTFANGTGDAFVVRSQDADHPIYLAAYMTGGAGNVYDPSSSFGGQGDPEFVNVVPTGQYLNAYSFYADPTYSETSLVIVRAKRDGQFKDVWLDCGDNLQGFKPIGTRGDYEYRRVDLAHLTGPGEKFGTKTCQNGLHKMRSDGPFTATLWGWDAFASYAYPGGMAQRKLVLTPLAPIQ